jgi:hypothetical protein
MLPTGDTTDPAWAGSVRRAVVAVAIHELSPVGALDERSAPATRATRRSRSARAAATAPKRALARSAPRRLRPRGSSARWEGSAVRSSSAGLGCSRAHSAPSSGAARPCADAGPGPARSASEMARHPSRLAKERRAVSELGVPKEWVRPPQYRHPYRFGVVGAANSSAPVSRTSRARSTTGFFSLPGLDSNQ